MGIPATIDDFVTLMRKSGVVDTQRLDGYLPRLQSIPQHLGRFAGILVRDGVLTHFQAEQFLQGKWHGFVIGKYKVLERLGWGGMGNVFLCEHTFMRRRVAVKVLATAHADDPATVQRFYREARAGAALDHPNIVRAYDINRDRKLHFLVMEYVDGTSFQEIVKAHGPMDVCRAAHYLSQAAVGLQHAHVTAGLVHRDIKPPNILVDRRGVVKILDMGLARFSHDHDDILTMKDTFVGTADYLAPEQALDSHRVDIRADIYSLGATFYFILSANTPFPKGSVAQKLIWHQKRQPTPIQQVRPEVPEGIAAVLAKMMAKDPADRYQTPESLLNDLAPFVQTPIGPPPEQEMPRLCRAAKGSEEAITLSATPPPAALLRPTSSSVASTPPAGAQAENVVKIARGSDPHGDIVSSTCTSLDEVAELRLQVRFLIEQIDRLRGERDAALAQLRQRSAGGEIATTTLPQLT
jgi:serine/threonine protein kinase